MLLNKMSKLLTLMNTLYVSVQSKTKQTNKQQQQQPKDVNFQCLIGIFTLSTIPTHHVLNTFSNNIHITLIITIFNHTNWFQ